MEYKNPVIRGMYPDPSICCVEDTYYLVNSTFEYVPGIPIFKSDDLVNWSQIGNCIIDSEEIGLVDCPSSGGIFAPTIRYHEGKFYIITTCFGRNGMKNFFITSENPTGSWSKPVFIDIQGIDPSLYWENGLTYVQYTCFGTIKQVIIDEITGNIIEGSKIITYGCGGRDTEGPHLWKKEDYYYLLLAEGGTREGHMVTLMRSKSVWGPFEASPYLPVVSNKDYSREPLQCVGHADWIQDAEGNDYLVALATRHVKHKTILGRETVLTPAYWTEDGWLRAKTVYMPVESQTSFQGKQIKNSMFMLDMQKKQIPLQMLSLRKRHDGLIDFKEDSVNITGNEYSLNDEASPMILALRQSEYNFIMKMTFCSEIEKQSDEAGLTMYMDSQHHFSFFMTKRNLDNSEKTVLVFRKCVDDLLIEKVIEMKDFNQITLIIEGDKTKYYFKYMLEHGEVIEAGWTYNKHLASSCVASPNTGVVGGIFVVGSKCVAKVTEFIYQELEEADEQ